MILSKKIVVLGHFGVGKSSIIRKFVTNEFSSDYKVTIGVHTLKKEISINNEDSVSLIIWDLEGTDRIDLINEAYLLGAHCFIYVFDVTRNRTYSGLEDIINKLKTKYPSSLVKTVGNKIDLLDKTEKKLEENTFSKISYLSSAKTGENIELMFQDIAKALCIN